ncbi:MAG: hypothetical protein EON90_02575 [Brevundimonas sp.]|nr:MAG: hypothetical protein EON90_02575 [Brevundimonas sp.]
MTDPTNVDDVIVIGQRRENGSMAPFPQRPSFTPPNPGDVSEIEPDIGDGQSDPCSDPEKFAEWERDAAAAKAAKDFVTRALADGEPDDRLAVREYGAWLIRMPDGSIGHGPIRRGTDTFDEGDGVTSVTLDFEGVDPSTIVGFIHSHNPGNDNASSAPAGDNSDVEVLNSVVALMNSYNPGSGSQARMYIVSRTLAGAGQTGYNKINVWTPGTIAALLAAGLRGPEVNPNGQPCSGLLTP